MLLSLREGFGSISTALIWSLGNWKVNCTMYRGKIDFQEHLALYYWVWNEIKVILLGHELLPTTMGKVYKLYLSLMKTWCVYLYTYKYTHTHVLAFFPLLLLMACGVLGLVLQDFLLTKFSWVPIRGCFAACNKSVLQDMWSSPFLKMKNYQTSFFSCLPLCSLGITWYCRKQTRGENIRGHGDIFSKPSMLKVKANICHLLNTKFILKVSGCVIRDRINTCLKNMSCACVQGR